MPNTNPTSPSAVIHTSFATQTARHRLLSWSDQKVSISMSGGKMSARAPLAKAPISVIRSPRSGIARARLAVCVCVCACVYM